MNNLVIRGNKCRRPTFRTTRAPQYLMDIKREADKGIMEDTNFEIIVNEGTSDSLPTYKEIVKNHGDVKEIIMITSGDKDDNTTSFVIKNDELLEVPKTRFMIVVKQFACFILYVKTYIGNKINPMVDMDKWHWVRCRKFRFKQMGSHCCCYI